jgi:hypothetical protein
VTNLRISIRSPLLRSVFTVTLWMPHLCIANLDGVSTTSRSRRPFTFLTKLFGANSKALSTQKYIRYTFFNIIHAYHYFNTIRIDSYSQHHPILCRPQCASQLDLLLQVMSPNIAISFLSFTTFFIINGICI